MSSHVSRRQLFTGLSGLAATGIGAAAVSATAAQGLGGNRGVPQHSTAPDVTQRYEIITGRVYQCDLSLGRFFISPDSPGQLPVYAKLCRAPMEPEAEWEGQYTAARRRAIQRFAKNGDAFSAYAVWRPDLFEAAPWRAIKLLSRNGETLARDCPVWADMPTRLRT